MLNEFLPLFSHLISCIIKHFEIYNLFAKILFAKYFTDRIDEKHNMKNIISLINNVKYVHDYLVIYIFLAKILSSFLRGLSESIYNYYLLI